MDTDFFFFIFTCTCRGSALSSLTINEEEFGFVLTGCNVNADTPRSSPPEAPSICTVGLFTMDGAAIGVHVASVLIGCCIHFELALDLDEDRAEPDFRSVGAANVLLDCSNATQSPPAAAAAVLVRFDSCRITMLV
jgi:hypothetical protein